MLRAIHVHVMAISNDVIDFMFHKIKELMFYSVQMFISLPRYNNINKCDS